MTTATANRQIRLRERPDGRIDERTFETVEEAVPEPGPGQALVQNLYLSIDPTNRAWIGEEPTYLPPVGIGEVMRAVGLGRVVASNSDDYPEGALVTGLVGWQDYTLAGGEGIPLTVVPELELPIECMLGALGVTGITAWFGVEEIGMPQEGETVVVSAAAGAVGSVAGPAREAARRACGRDRGRRRQVRLAGRRARLRRGRSTATTRDWREQLRAACPNGVDVDFENVGGEIMDAVFAMLNLNARVRALRADLRVQRASRSPGRTCAGC